MSVLLQHTYQVTWKSARFEWVLEYEKALQQAQDALPFGPYNPTDQIALEVSGTDRDAVWSFCQAPIGDLQKRLLGF